MDRVIQPSVAIMKNYYQHHVFRSVNFGSSQKVVAEEIIEDIEDEPPAKTSKLEVIAAKPEVKKKESWNKSIGVLSKRPLTNLVRSKKVDTGTSSKDIISLVTDDNQVTTSFNNNTTNATVISSKNQESSKSSPNVSTMVSNQEDTPVASGLSLLANYSGSDSE